MNQTLSTLTIALHNQRSLKVERVLLWAALGLLALVGVTFSAPFAMADDHGVVSFLMRPTSLAQDLQTDFAFGRFRPLYWTIRHVEYHLFSANTLAWHLFTYGVGVVTLALLFRLLRRFVPGRYAAYGVLILFFYLGTSSIWYRLGPQEGVGTLLVLGALTALAARRDGWFAMLAVLAAAQKESFTLLLPALLVLYIAVRGRVVSPTTVALGAFGVVFAAVIALLKFGAPDGYGAVITGEVGSGLLLNLVRYTFPVAGLIPALLAGLVATRRERLWTAIVVALWLMPQAALHAALLFERYYFPGILIAALLTPIALYRLRRKRFLFRVALAFLLLVMPVNGLASVDQLQGAIAYTESSTAFQTELQRIATANPSLARIDYSQDIQIEERASARAFLEWYGYQGDIDFGCTGALFC